MKILGVKFEWFPDTKNFYIDFCTSVDIDSPELFNIQNLLTQEGFQYVNIFDTVRRIHTFRKTLDIEMTDENLLDISSDYMIFIRENWNA